MSKRDDIEDFTFTFREQAAMEKTSRLCIAKMKEEFPSLLDGGAQTISWRDFLYSLAKGAAAMILGFICLAALWATINYIKAGAPPVPGVTH